jgi:hypothetical protein
MAGVPAVEDEPTTGALIQRSGEFSGSLLEPRPDVEFPGVEVKGVHQVALSDSISADRQPEEHVRSTI